MRTKQRGSLERVLQRKLQVALLRPCVLERDITKRTVVDARIRIAVTDNVECVEGIEAEAQGVFSDNVEVLECR